MMVSGLFVGMLRARVVCHTPESRGRRVRVYTNTKQKCPNRFRNTRNTYQIFDQTASRTRE